MTIMAEVTPTKGRRPMDCGRSLTDEEIVKHLGVVYYKKWSQAQDANYPLDLLGRPLHVGMVLKTFGLAKKHLPKSLLYHITPHGEKATLMTVDGDFLVVNFRDIEDNMVHLEYRGMYEEFLLFLRKLGQMQRDLIRNVGYAKAEKEYRLVWEHIKKVSQSLYFNKLNNTGG